MCADYASYSGRCRSEVRARKETRVFQGVSLIILINLGLKFMTSCLRKALQLQLQEAQLLKGEYDNNAMVSLINGRVRAWHSLLRILPVHRQPHHVSGISEQYRKIMFWRRNKKAKAEHQEE